MAESRLMLYVVIGLIIFGVYWYNNPDNGHKLIKSGVDKTHSLFSQVTHKVSSASSQTTAKPYNPNCPTDISPVCDTTANATYSNQCNAENAGAINTKPGVC